MMIWDGASKLGRDYTADILAERTAELKRLRALHDALLAAAKEVIAQADRDTNRLEDGTPNRTEECWKSYNLLCAAIAKAEELTP